MSGDWITDEAREAVTEAIYDELGPECTDADGAAALADAALAAASPFVAAAVAAALNDSADEIGRLSHLFDPQSPREQMVRDVLQSVAADLRVRAAAGGTDA